MRAKPYRERDELSQSYNDGVVVIYSVTNAAEPGRLPRETLTQLVRCRYQERKLGLYRAYLASQNQVRVDKVIRVPKSVPLTTQDIAITEDGKRYRIDLAQLVRDVHPMSVDLQLSAIEQEVPHDLV